EFAWGGRARDRRRVRETVDGREHHFTYRLPGEPAMVRIDPDHWLLARFDVTLPPACWRAQLARDRPPAGRIAAAHARGRLRSAEATVRRVAALRRERHWLVRGEIASVLGEPRSPAALSALLRAIRVPDPRVRRHAARALAGFRSPAIVPPLSRLAREDT